MGCWSLPVLAAARELAAVAAPGDDLQPCFHDMHHNHTIQSCYECKRKYMLLVDASGSYGKQ